MRVPRTRKLERLLLIAATVVSTWGALRLVTLPEPIFTADVPVDDALYFSVPARHLVDGYGFSFDKVFPSNGVQTMWALCTVVLAAVLRDDVLLLRGMCLLSGLLWWLAGLVLWRALRVARPALGPLVGCGFMLAAFTDRIAFQGMENGLHALLGAWLCSIAMRLPTRSPESMRRLPLVLGLACALYALSRTEGGLLAVLIGPCIGLGLVPRRGVGLHVRGAALFLLPCVVLVGGTALLSKLWFDAWTPISGEVKLSYEAEWGRTSAEGLGWHFKLVRRLALAPLFDNVQLALRELGWPVSGAALRRLVWIPCAIGVLGHLVRFVRRRRPPSTRVILGWVLLGFATSHFVVMVQTLPHFTPYCIWYFTPQITALWLGLAWSLHGAIALLPGRRSFAIASRLARLGLPALMLCCASFRLADPPSPDANTSMFRRAGLWLEQSLPAGQRIGSLSAGLVGAYAKSHHVYNLDGLIAGAEYVRNYLSKHRFAEFFADQRIHWFADYQPFDSARHGIQWRGTIPLERLRLHRWWRLDGQRGYAVWEVLPPGTHRTILGPDAVNRLAELRFAAEVLGAMRVLGPGEAVPAGLRVVASTVAEPSGELRHLVVDDAALAGLDLPFGAVPAPLPVEVRAGGLLLYGLDIPRQIVARGKVLPVTLFWQRIGAVDDAREFELCAEPEAGGSAVTHVRVATCHGTRLPSTWRTGQAVVETFAIPIRAAAPRGTVALWLVCTGDPSVKARVGSVVVR
ncbi:MAG: hypothetical protein KDC87_00695 [Planctomycetes bacterium]|nr:hypothetical protein [Planctomycetota bacterium]